MPTLYIEIPITEALPTEIGTYKVILAKDTIYEDAAMVSYYPNSGFNSSYTKNCALITHWLKEVEMPSDEKIKDYIQFELKWEVDGTAETNDMIKIAKWMRDLILNKK